MYGPEKIHTRVLENFALEKVGKKLLKKSGTKFGSKIFFCNPKLTIQYAILEKITGFMEEMRPNLISRDRNLYENVFC